MFTIELTHIDVLLGPAPIDWCEPNRPETNPFSIMEWNNTWSNIAYIIAGLSLLFRWSFSPNRDPLFLAYGVFVVLTGVTSAWFHATLLFVAQKADEFFESASVVALLYFHLLPAADRKVQPSTRFFAFSAHTVALGLGVICIPELFCEVNLILSVLLCFKTALARVSTVTDRATQFAHRDKFYTAFLAAGLGFALWGIDRAFCDVTNVQSLNLHAFGWHPLTAAALYLGGAASLDTSNSLAKQTKRN